MAIKEGASVGVAGTRSYADPTPLDADARFHLGSDTKAMTAVLIAQLVEADELDLDAPIVDVLPDAQVDTTRAAVTVRDLLGHRSGLRDDFDLAALHSADDPVQARREVVHAALRSTADQTADYAYANINYMLAGVIVEQITDKPWTEAIAAQIFLPLGMTTCGFGVPAGDHDPLGHSPDGDPVPQDAPVTDNPAALGPAATVHCSLADWATFVGTLLDVLAGTDSPILSATTAAELFAGTDDYVAGWLRIKRAGEIVYTHDGSNTLWYARAILRPESGDAVLLATNTGEASGVAAIDELTDSLLTG